MLRLNAENEERIQQMVLAGLGADPDDVVAKALYSLLLQASSEGEETVSLEQAAATLDAPLRRVIEMMESGELPFRENDGERRVLLKPLRALESRLAREN
jgi:hypothetical protein